MYNFFMLFIFLEPVQEPIFFSVPAHDFFGAAPAPVFLGSGSKRPKECDSSALCPCQCRIYLLCTIVGEHWSLGRGFTNVMVPVFEEAPIQKNISCGHVRKRGWDQPPVCTKIVFFIVCKGEKCSET